MVVVVVALGGCTGAARPLHLVPETRLVVQAADEDVVLGFPVRGEACSHTILFICERGDSGVAQAYDSLVSAAPRARGFMNIAIDQRSTWWLVGTTYCVEMRATPIYSGADAPRFTPAPEVSPAAPATEEERPTASVDFGNDTARVVIKDRSKCDPNYLDARQAPLAVGKPLVMLRVSQTNSRGRYLVRDTRGSRVWVNEECAERVRPEVAPAASPTAPPPPAAPAPAAPPQ